MDITQFDIVSLYDRGSYLNEIVGLGRYIIDRHPELVAKVLE